MRYRRTYVLNKDENDREKERERKKDTRRDIEREGEIRERERCKAYRERE